MINKKYIGGALGIGVLALGIALCPGKKHNKLINPMTTKSFSQLVQKIPFVAIREHTVKKGDYLSKIVYDELGLRGKDIYDKCLDIQTINNLGSERDIYKVIDGELVSGKDGFIDLLYPDEKLKLF